MGQEEYLAGVIQDLTTELRNQKTIIDILTQDKNKLTEEINVLRELLQIEED